MSSSLDLEGWKEVTGYTARAAKRGQREPNDGIRRRRRRTTTLPNPVKVYLLSVVC